MNKLFKKNYSSCLFIFNVGLRYVLERLISKILKTTSLYPCWGHDLSIKKVNGTHVVLSECGRDVEHQLCLRLFCIKTKNNNKLFEGKK